MKRIKKPKKRPPRPTLLTPEEEAVIAPIVKNFRNADLAETVSMVPNSRYALILVERLPLDDETPIPLLLALKDGFKDKQVRRAVKRALFKLKNKGVPVEEFDTEKSATSSILKPPQEEKPAAYVGPVDMSGFRAVLVTLKRTMRGVDVGVGVVSDEQGIQHFLFGAFSKKRTKEMKDHLSEEAGPLVETSFSHAATILEDAYQRHLELNLDSPTEYLEFRPWLLDNASLLDRPVIYDVMPDASTPEASLTDSQLDKLFGHNLMESWLIEFEPLRPFIEDILKLVDSPIVLTDAQKSDRAKEIKDKGIKELFPPLKRAILKKRFEEMAYLFFKLGEEHFSQLSIAAARSMDHEETILSKNPVIEFLLERSLDFYRRKLEENAESKNQRGDPTPRIIVP